MAKIPFMTPKDKLRWKRLGEAFTNTVRSNAKLYDRWVAGKSAKQLKSHFTFKLGEIKYLFDSKNPAQFWQLETGREEGKRPPHKPLVDWVKRRNITQDRKQVERIAYAIANDIAKNGTRRTDSRYGRKKNKKTDQIFTKPFERFQKQVDLFALKYSDEIVKRAIIETDKIFKQ